MLKNYHIEEFIGGGIGSPQRFCFWFSVPPLVEEKGAGLELHLLDQLGLFLQPSLHRLCLVQPLALSVCSCVRHYPATGRGVGVCIHYASDI